MMWLINLDLIFAFFRVSCLVSCFSDGVFLNFWKEFSDSIVIVV